MHVVHKILTIVSYSLCKLPQGDTFAFLFVRQVTLIFFLGLYVALSAQDFVPARFDCLVVDGDDVTVQWQLADDPATQFISYELFRFNPQTTVTTSLFFTNDITDDQFLHLGTLSATDSVMYFIETRYAEGGTAVSLSTDTIATIDLSLQNLIDKAILTWNEPLAGDSSYTHYELQIDYGEGWISVDSIPRGTSIYEYEVMVCHGLDPSVSISYRLLLHHVSGCVGVSNVRQGDFQDLNAPATPIIETVTVDTATNQAVVCWFPNTEPDIGSYLILQYFSPTAQTTFPDVIPHPTTVFQNITSNAAQESEGYLVVAQDTCIHLPVNATVPAPNRSGSNIQGVHFTLHLETEFLRCERSNRLRWNTYFGWPEGEIEAQVVYGGLSSGPLQALDTIPASAISYTHQGVEVLENYSYVIKVLSSAGRKPSLSNKASLFTDYPDIPDFAYLANVSVVNNDVIELKAYVEPAADNSRYAFQKLDRFGEEFETLFTNQQTVADADGFITRFDDFDIESDQERYTYRLIALDSCGFEVAESEIQRNILLRVRPDFDTRQNLLTWPTYINWDGGVQEYVIYRFKDDFFSNTPYAIVPGTQNFFRDDLSDDADFEGGGRWCYLVEAVEAVNSFNREQRSRSNIACAEQEPVLFMPNAIVIGGLNNELKPQGGYFDRNRYELTIWNRWSSIIFQTQDFDQGWDGTINGTPVPEGLYLYALRYFTEGGVERLHHGHITVLYSGD
jgi:gliding motility-associated-like protein